MIAVSTNGNSDYIPVFATVSRGGSSQLRPAREAPSGEKGRVASREQRVIYGSPDLGNRETTDVEHFNGILREITGRLVRKPKASRTVPVLRELHQRVRARNFACNALDRFRFL